MSKFLITEEKEINRKIINKRFFVNGVLVCECVTSGDYFCTIGKNGSPSRIRDKFKKTYKTSWKISNIKNILGGNFDINDFKNSYPDLTWGDQGSLISMKRVKEIFGKY